MTIKRIRTINAVRNTLSLETEVVTDSNRIIYINMDVNDRGEKGEILDDNHWVYTKPVDEADFEADLTSDECIDDVLKLMLIYWNFDPSFRSNGEWRNFPQPPELKKAVKCPDGTYVEGTAEELADICYRYDQDFSDENITEIEEFARANGKVKAADKMKWLLESRHEIAAGKMNLGQMKIDFSEGSVTEPIQEEDGTRIELWLEPHDNKVVISIFGYDDQGSWEASDALDLSEFLELEEGKLEVIIGRAMSYKNYLEE